MKPGENDKFYPSQVKLVVETVLKQELDGTTKVDEKWIEDWADFCDDFEALSTDIADKIKTTCLQKLNLPRYKIIVQVTIGQMKDQGARVTSRCLWDTTTDNYATANFKNRHIWASAIIFGLYAE